MCGCWRRATASASSRKRFSMRAPANGPARIILRATSRLRRVFRALYTTPMPARRSTVARVISVIRSASQPDLLGDALDGAGQLLAQAVRRAAALRRDVGPLAAAGAVVGQLALVRGQPAAELLEEVLGFHLLAG